MEQNYFLTEHILNRLKRDMLYQEMGGTTGLFLVDRRYRSLNNNTDWILEYGGISISSSLCNF